MAFFERRLTTRCQPCASASSTTGARGLFFKRILMGVAASLTAGRQGEEVPPDDNSTSLKDGAGRVLTEPEEEGGLASVHRCSLVLPLGMKGFARGDKEERETCALED